MPILSNALKINVSKVFARNTFTSLNGLSSLFTTSPKYYHQNSIPAYNMTEEKFRDPKSEDLLGVYRSPEDLEEWYLYVLNELGWTVEEDRASLNKALTGNEFSPSPPISDPHGFRESGAWGENITNKAKDVSGETPIPVEIIYPGETMKSVAEHGGIIRHVVLNCTKREILRNLKGLDKYKEKTAEGPGQLTSLLQYHDSRLDISFEALNVVCENIGQKPLSIDQLKDEETVTKYINQYLESVLPGASKDFIIDMDKQVISTNIISTSHSSALIDFPMKDGTRGIQGIEVGRTELLFGPNGELITNTREQVICQGIFQTMNMLRLASRDVPKTKEAYRSLPDVTMTPDHFGKINHGTPIAELVDKDNAPSKGLPNLLNNEKTDGSTSLYTSAGTPLAVKSVEVSAAGKIAVLFVFLSGREPGDSLRFGPYYAHDAQAFESRACEFAVVSGADFGGVPLKDLLPNFQYMSAYDFSQAGREAIYESNLFAELSLPPAPSKPEIYSKKTANDYLKWGVNTYTAMQFYYKLEGIVKEREISELSLGTTLTEETSNLRKYVDGKALNLFRRYQHVWCIFGFLVLSSVRTYGLESILDKATESTTITKESITSGSTVKRTSRFLDAAILLVEERIKHLEKQGVIDPKKPLIKFKNLRKFRKNDITLSPGQMSAVIAVEALEQLQKLKTDVSKAV